MVDLHDEEEPGDSAGPEGILPAGRLKRLGEGRTVDLSRFSTDELIQESLLRISKGGSCCADQAGVLAMAIDRHCDEHENRFGTRRLRDLFGMFRWFRGHEELSFQNATIVDLGCGGRSPFSLLMIYVLLGAKHGIAIDLDGIDDPELAIQGISKCASWMLLDHESIIGDFPITREQIVSNANSFDFGKLRQGSSDGLPEDRLEFRRESIEETSLEDSVADLVVSNSFLEHVPDVDAAVSEIARITKTGGFSIHNIDGVDHRTYFDPSVGLLDILFEESKEPLVHGSNRLRLLQFPAVFERHGFETLDLHPYRDVPITSEFRAKLAEKFRSLPDEVLKWTQGQVFFRKR